MLLGTAARRTAFYNAKMAHYKSKTGQQEAWRVNVKDDYEVAYWCTKFGCTPQQLKAAVKKVGVMAAAVEAELKRGSARI